MQLLTQKRLAANAYRTLGLSASAGQAAIENAARRMRIWPDPQHIAPTPWDLLPLLGPLPRSRNDIEQAVSALNEPTSRLQERLLWYHGHNPPPADGGAASALIGAPDVQAPPQIKHDAMVAGLHLAYRFDPDIADASRWRGVMQRLVELSTNAHYADWLAEAESSGEFEKRAEPGEIEEAIESLPSALAAAMVPKAQAALDMGNIAACAGIVEMLRSADCIDGVGASLEKLLDGLEDALMAKCREMHGDLHAKMLTNHQAPAGFYSRNARAAWEGAAFYNKNLRPAFEKFSAVAQKDEPRLLRVRSKFAEELALLAMAWEWSGEFVTAQETLLQAQELAAGSATAASIHKELLRIKPRADEQRKSPRAHARRLKLAQNAAVSAKKPKMNLTAVRWIGAAVVVSRLVAFYFANTSRELTTPRMPAPDNEIPTIENPYRTRPDNPMPTLPEIHLPPMDPATRILLENWKRNQSLTPATNPAILPPYLTHIGPQDLPQTLPGVLKP